MIAGLCGTTSENPLPNCDSDKNLADDFADFFIGKIEKKIRDNLNHHPKYKPAMNTNTSKLSEFFPLWNDDTNRKDAN